MRLEAVQQAMIAAILHGPDQLPGALFTGPRAAALRGMAVHANTISHARLVALEDTFPRTRALLGEAEFNRISRGYLAAGGGAHEPLATIGRDFPDTLAEDAAALARFEWLWLESYHAAEAPALAMADLAGLGEDALLALIVARHPAARLSIPVILDGNAALPMLLARPDAEVVATRASPGMATLFESLAVPNALATLLSLDCDGALPALIALIEAGAITIAGDPA